MKLNNKFKICLIAPWVVVTALAFFDLFAMGCGTDPDTNLYLIDCLYTTSIVALIIDAVVVVGYLSIPHIAGMLCVWLAKNWKKIDRLANISASLYFDANSKGYYKLYRKGVKTYNVLNRGVRNDSAKSRTA